MIKFQNRPKEIETPTYRYEIPSFLKPVYQPEAWFMVTRNGHGDMKSLPEIKAWFEDNGAGAAFAFVEMAVKAEGFKELRWTIDGVETLIVPLVIVEDE